MSTMGKWSVAYPSEMGRRVLANPAGLEVATYEGRGLASAAALECDALARAVVVGSEQFRRAYENTFDRVWTPAPPQGTP